MLVCNDAVAVGGEKKGSVEIAPVDKLNVELVAVIALNPADAEPSTKGWPLAIETELTLIVFVAVGVIRLSFKMMDKLLSFPAVKTFCKVFNEAAPLIISLHVAVIVVDVVCQYRLLT